MYNVVCTVHYMNSFWKIDVFHYREFTSLFVRGYLAIRLAFGIIICGI